VNGEDSVSNGPQPPTDGVQNDPVSELSASSSAAKMNAEAYYAAYLVQGTGRTCVDAVLDAFSRQVHGSLNPTEVAYLIANDGRRIVGCDRLSVGVRRGKRVDVEAVSGSDLVDRRSNLVQRMSELFRAALDWGEPVTYDGTRDDSMPPRVLEALDRYLSLCPCRFLVLIPLVGARQTTLMPPAAAGMLLECFQPPSATETMRALLDTTGHHAAVALSNALEHDAIPLRWFWQKLGRVTNAFTRPAKARWLMVALLTAIITSVLIFVPYPLRVEAHGKLLPEERRWVYAPVEGQVIRFEEGVQPGSLVTVNQSLILMYDVQLEVRMSQLANDIAAAQQAVDALTRDEGLALNETERLRLSAEKRQKEYVRDRKTIERRALRDRVNADESRPGYFRVCAPLTGTVLNADFRENWTNRHVKPSEPLLRIGDKTRPWEVELQIPQQDMAHVIRAFAPGLSDAELRVDLQLRALPTRTFVGKLPAARMAGQANHHRDANGNTTPTVRANVRIDGADIEPDRQIPGDLLVAGTEVRAKVDCGARPLGFVLFHGVWEFFHRLTF
jgi:multidrug efflux pump subunit AcrA (membrane-fusion protein)